MNSATSAGSLREANRRAEEFYRSSAEDLDTVQASDAFNLDFAGERAKPDFITMP